MGHARHAKAARADGLDTTALPNGDGGTGAARPLADSGHVCVCGNADGTVTDELWKDAEHSWGHSHCLPIRFFAFLTQHKVSFPEEQTL